MKGKAFQISYILFTGMFDQSIELISLRIAQGKFDDAEKLIVDLPEHLKQWGNIQRAILLDNRNWKNKQAIEIFDTVINSSSAELEITIFAKIEKLKMITFVNSFTLTNEQYEEEFENIEKLIRIIEDKKYIDYLLAKLNEVKGDYEEIENFNHKRAIELKLGSHRVYKKLRLEDDIKWNIIVLANAYRRNKQYEEALEILEECRTLCEKSKSDYILAYVYQGLGLLSRDKGQFEKNRKYHEKSIQLLKKVGVAVEPSWSYVNLMWAYTQFGEFNKALQGLSEIIKYAENHNLLDSEVTNNSYFSIGEIYYRTGNYEKANYYYEEGFKGWKRIQHFAYQGMNLYGMIRNLVGQGNIEAATNRFKELTNLKDRVNKNDWAIIEYLIRCHSLAEAFLLKSSPRILNKARAQVIYDGILKDKNLEVFYRLDVLKYQCEIFLSELRAQPSEEVFKEAKEVIYELKTVSERENLMLSQVDTHILLSRFALIENDFEKASFSLQEAENVVNKYNLAALHEIIEREKILLDEQFRIHSDLVSKNANLQERVEASKIGEYLHFALQQNLENYDK